MSINYVEVAADLLFMADEMGATRPEICQNLRRDYNLSLNKVHDLFWAWMDAGQPHNINSIINNAWKDLMDD